MTNVRIELISYEKRVLEYSDGTIRHFTEDEVAEIKAQCKREYEEMRKEMGLDRDVTIIWFS